MKESKGENVNDSLLVSATVAIAGQFSTACPNPSNPILGTSASSISSPFSVAYMSPASAGMIGAASAISGPSSVACPNPSNPILGTAASSISNLFSVACPDPAHPILGTATSSISSTFSVAYMSPANAGMIGAATVVSSSLFNNAYGMVRNPFVTEAMAASRPEQSLFASVVSEAARIVHPFPAESFGEGVTVAGFKFVIPPAPQPVENGGSCGSVSFHPGYNVVLTQVEQHLRRFIKDMFVDNGIHQWAKQRVSLNVRLRWLDRQNEDREAGRPVFDLIQYADFMDLHDIIVQRNNWSEIFVHVFRNKEDFSVSLKRLCRMRNAEAHRRPLGLFDVLALVVEAKRILMACDFLN